MEPTEFIEIDKSGRERKSRLFELSAAEAKASESEVNALESIIGAKLPEKFRWFLMQYGGGEFGYEEVYSAAPSGEYSLARIWAETRDFLPEGLIPFSHDGCGGYYVFQVVGGVAQERVMYWDHEDYSVSAGKFMDVLEYLSFHAYESHSERRLRETGRLK